MAKHRADKGKSSSKKKEKKPDLTGIDPNREAPLSHTTTVAGIPRSTYGGSTEPHTELTPEQRRLANLRPPWKPGQSGNPSGKRKKLFDPLLREFLETIDPKDKKKRTRAAIFVEAFYKRALKKSDQLAREMLARIDGSIERDPDVDIVQAGVKVIILDAPRPQRPAINAVPVLPANQSAKGDD